LDFPLLQKWLAEPHIVQWWRESLALDGIESKYGPRIDGTEPTHVFMIEVEGIPEGWIQWYRWEDYPKHAAILGADTDSAGIDLSIGRKEMLGKGLGPEAIRQFIDQFVFADSTINSVISDPEESNIRSRRAFEKAGFTFIKKVQLPGEPYRRCVVQL
jgi:RimJ/RimL family protein N-acetyltransferase